MILIDEQRISGQDTGHQRIRERLKIAIGKQDRLGAGKLDDVAPVQHIGGAVWGIQQHDKSRSHRTRKLDIQHLIGQRIRGCFRFRDDNWGGKRTDQGRTWLERLRLSKLCGQQERAKSNKQP